VVEMVDYLEIIAGVSIFMTIAFLAAVLGGLIEKFFSRRK